MRCLIFNKVMFIQNPITLILFLNKKALLQRYSLKHIFGSKAVS